MRKPFVFWDHTIPEPNTGCLLWLGHSYDRYGNFKIKGKGVRAHRYAYELTYGPIPTGLCVLHGCDTPLCVNPEHLFLGTQKENAMDREAKGRGRIAPAIAKRWALPSCKGMRGVRRTTAGTQYRAFYRPMTGERRVVYLGVFASREQAAAAYDANALVRIGPSARLNFPRV